MSAGGGHPGGRALVAAALLAGAVLAVFWPLGGHEFINFDDDLYIYENLRVLGGLTWDGVVWAFTDREYSANWHPLTWLSHMFDAQIFGGSAGGHHLMGLAWHAANTLLLFAVLRGLTGAFWRSAAVAALFAVHPLHVETVAWASDRKDLLAAFFWFAALACYRRYVSRPSPLRYLPVVAAAAGALMSKPMPVSLPLVLLLLDWWPLGRLAWGPGASGRRGRGTLPPTRVLLEKAPLLLLSALSALVTLSMQERAMTASALLPLAHRLSNSVVSSATYLFQTVWPAKLGVFYPLRLDPPPPPQVVTSALFLVLITAAAAASLRRGPALAAGWAWFLVTLLPAAGIIQVGSQARADRYTYVPLIGIFLAAVWVLGDAAASRRRLEAALRLGGVAAIGILMVAAHRQVLSWRDTETVFLQALKATGDDNWLAHNNLADHYLKTGRRGLANAHFARSMIQDPNYQHRLRRSRQLRPAAP